MSNEAAARYPFGDLVGGHPDGCDSADAAIARIEALPVVKGKVVRLRMEELA